MGMISQPIPVRALHPRTGELENAALYENHFGTGRHGIRFICDGAFNTPYFAAWETAWEPRVTASKSNGNPIRT